MDKVEVESEEVNTKPGKEKAAAEDVRKRAMESLSENKRRSDADRDDVTSSKPKKSKKQEQKLLLF